MQILDLVGAFLHVQVWLTNVTVQHVVTFVALARRLQNRIAWQELASHRQTDVPPNGLPNTIISFLANAVGVEHHQVIALWEALRGVIWDSSKIPTAVTAPIVDDYAPFALYGEKREILAEEFYPPTRYCLNDQCPTYLVTGSRQSMYDVSRTSAVLYTLARGAYPVGVTSLYCRCCRSTYTLNYCRQTDTTGDSWRIYYEGLPRVLQVEKHMLFEDKLCNLFRSLTVHSQ
ncbi:hypothetical protein CALCODRAFT_535685 [Calocera cornea HHB12733]|uniref:CxC5 like cysteine cluster associated with KDZ domain-containing protein n=1 Tax=Calocera cornea HHB12733 TaxID=1353952 RepID=A0A165CF90_9BASI|nr:hypothetical protein CALCODRAFT_535685 [Calocera cornea HHB12733]